MQLKCKIHSAMVLRRTHPWTFDSVGVTDIIAVDTQWLIVIDSSLLSFKHTVNIISQNAIKV